MKRISILALLVLLITSEGVAQKTDASKLARNGAYTEFYVIRPDFSDGFVSINYERVLGKRFRSNIRVGMWPDFKSTISFPISISWITNPDKKHHFEYGVGTVFRVEHYVSDDPTQTKEWFYDVPAFLIPLMYRYQKNNGFYFRGGSMFFSAGQYFPRPPLALATGFRLKNGR